MTKRPWYSSAESTSVVLGKFTIFIGENASGKSTLFSKVLEEISTRYQNCCIYFAINKDSPDPPRRVLRELGRHEQDPIGLGHRAAGNALDKAMQCEERDFLFWEHPETNLHPRLQEQLISALVKQKPNYVFTTHSSHIIECLLAEVYEGHLREEDLKIYQTSLVNGKIVAKECPVYLNGQITSAMRSFSEAVASVAERFWPDR